MEWSSQEVSERGKPLFWFRSKPKPYSNWYRETETKPKPTDRNQRTLVILDILDILTPERNRLCPENAEKVLFLRENLPIVGFEYYFNPSFYPFF